MFLSLWMLCISAGCTEPNPNLDSSKGSTGSGGTSVGPLSADGGATVSDTGSSGPTAPTSDATSDAVSSTGGDSGLESSSGSGGSTDADGSATTTGPTSVCDSNGVLEAGEMCDDDNSFEGDGCQECQLEMGFHCVGEPSQCFVECDPLDPQCVRGTEICIPIDVYAFACAFDLSGAEGQYGDVCAFTNVCDPGLFCALPETVPGCAGPGCCSDYCDLGDLEPSSTCAGVGEGQECIPWFEEGEAPDGLDDVGACAVPA